MAGSVTFQFVDEEAPSPESYQFVDEPPKREWNASDIVREPLAIASEIGTGLLNLPVKAAKGYMGLYDLATGGNLQSATDAIGNRNAITSPLPSKSFEALGENVISPSVNKVAGMLNTDPSNVAAFVEAGGDIATLLGVGWGKGSPTSVALNRTGNLAKNTADAAADRLEAFTLKQKIDLDPAIRASNVRTALEGDFRPNVRGINKLNTEIGSLESLMDAGLARGESQGVMGSFDKAINNIENLRYEASNTGSPLGNMGLIDKEIAKIQNNPKLGYPPRPDMSVPIRELQDMKVKQGRDLQDSYGSDTPAFQKTIDKARVRGYKDEIVQKLDVAFPELSATNQKLGTFYQLKKSLENAANRIENSNSMLKGIVGKTAFGGAAGYAAGGSTGSAIGSSLGALMGVVEHPAIAPLLARQLYKVNKGKMTHKQALDEVRARMLGVAGGLASTQNDNNY